MRFKGAKIIKTRFFPKFFGFDDRFKYKFFLSIGSNIEPLKNIKLFFAKFMKDKRFHIIENSIMIQNPAFGYELQSDFLNAIIYAQTSLNQYETLKILHHYEFFFKRVRSFKNAPRTLDLDIVSFDKNKSYTDKLILPHYGFDNRLSIIVPMGLMKGKR